MASNGYVTYGVLNRISNIIPSQNSGAAALLDDGTWMLLYPDSAPFTICGIGASAGGIKALACRLEDRFIERPLHRVPLQPDA